MRCWWSARPVLNSRRLVEVAAAGCGYSQLVQRAADIDWRALKGVTSIGITAGSAPELLVTEVMDALRTAMTCGWLGLRPRRKTLIESSPRAARTGIRTTPSLYPVSFSRLCRGPRARHGGDLQRGHGPGSGLPRRCFGGPWLSPRHLPALAAATLGLAAVLHTSGAPVPDGEIRRGGLSPLPRLAGVEVRRGACNQRHPKPPIRLCGRPARRAPIDTLNPELSIFPFSPFLWAAPPPTTGNLDLGAVFMAMTFAVFTLYGVFAASPTPRERRHHAQPRLCRHLCRPRRPPRTGAHPVTKDDTTISVYDAEADDYSAASPPRPWPTRSAAFNCRLSGWSSAVAPASWRRKWPATAWRLTPPMPRPRRSDGPAHPGVTASLATFDDIPLRGRCAYHDGRANFSLLHAPRSAMPAHLAALKRALNPGASTSPSRRARGRTSRPAGPLLHLLHRARTGADAGPDCDAGSPAPRRSASGRETGWTAAMADWFALTAHG